MILIWTKVSTDQNFATKSLRKVGLPDVLETKSNEFSGGYRAFKRREEKRIMEVFHLFFQNFSPIKSTKLISKQ